MTKADELYLKKFMQAREDAELVEAERQKQLALIQKAKAEKQMHEMFGPGKINYDINIRLLEER